MDNNSDDFSIDALHQNFPNVAVIRNTSNVGYAAGNNIGARYLLEMRCAFLMFINPDVSLKSDTVGLLFRTIQVDRIFGCVGGVPLNPGKLSPAARTRPSPMQKIVLYGPLQRIPYLRNRCKDHLVDGALLLDGTRVYAVLGACVMFRATAFDQIGGFDEATFLYEEEFIVAERLQASGWQTVVSTAALYEHAIGSSTARIPFRRRLHFVASEQHLLRHYYNWRKHSLVILRLYRYFEWLVYAFYVSLRLIAGALLRRRGFLHFRAVPREGGS